MIWQAISSPGVTTSELKIPRHVFKWGADINLIIETVILEQLQMK